MAFDPSIVAWWAVSGLGSYLVPSARAWPLGLPELDPLAMVMLALSLAPAAVLIWGSIGARRFPDLFVLTIFYGGAALVMMAVTNLVFFYLAWEVLALCCWGLGRWGTALVGRPGIPANAGIALGSLFMFAALAILAWDSRSLDMAGLHTESSALVQRLLLAACFFKAWGILGQAWRAVEGRAFAVSQAILAGGGVLAVGIYPLARLHSGPVDWPTPWQPEAVAVGIVVAALAALAALGEAGLDAPGVAQAAQQTIGTTAVHRSLAYVSFSVFSLTVVILAIQGSALAPEWVLWALSSGLAIGGVYAATSLAGSGEITFVPKPNGEGWQDRWPRVAAGAGYLLAGATVIGVPPSVGFTLRMIMTLQLFLTNRTWLLLGFAAWTALVFLSLCRLAILLWFQKNPGPVHWPLALAAALLLDIAILAWFSISGTLPAELATLLLQQGG